MKKIIFCCICMLFIFSSYSYAKNLNVRFMTKNITITTPDGITEKYTKKEDIPDILYSSKIMTFGMSVISYHGLEIVLKNNQGIWFNKNPITKEIMISKVENSKAGVIELQFDTTTVAEMSPDTKIGLTFDRETSTITMKVISGSVYMQQKGTSFELGRDEAFKYVTTKNKKHKKA